MCVEGALAAGAGFWKSAHKGTLSSKFTTSSTQPRAIQLELADSARAIATWDLALVCQRPFGLATVTSFEIQSACLVFGPKVWHRSCWLPVHHREYPQPESAVATVPDRLTMMDAPA